MNEPQLVRDFLENRGLIMGYLCALARDVQIAEEAFQELGLKVVEQAGKGTRVANFPAWAREIARNLVTDHFRKRAKEIRLQQISESMAQVVSQAFEENVVSPEASRLRREYLSQCLGDLPERMREVVKRRYANCAALQEIASAIGWKVESVKVALSRARKALFDCIRGKLRAAETG